MESDYSSADVLVTNASCVVAAAAAVVELAGAVAPVARAAALRRSAHPNLAGGARGSTSARAGGSNLRSVTLRGIKMEVFSFKQL